MASREEIEALARIAVDCGFALHRDLGPGMLESVYSILMFEGLRQRGVHVDREVPVRISYNGIVVDNAFRADLVVERCLLIEAQIDRAALTSSREAGHNLSQAHASALGFVDEFRIRDVQGWRAASREQSSGRLSATASRLCVFARANLERSAFRCLLDKALPATHAAWTI